MFGSKSHAPQSAGVQSLKAAIGATIVAAALLAAQAASAADLKRNQKFDIPAQSMATALLRFAEQTGIQVTAEGASLQVMKTSGVHGDYQVTAALSILLKGSGLTYKVVDHETIVVRKERVIPERPAGTETSNATQLLDADASRYLAQAELEADEQDAKSPKNTKVKTGMSKDGVEEMIVEEGRIKPFTDANVDIPRTTKDPQPYYIFDSQTIEQSAAANISDFLKQRLTMNAVTQLQSQITGNGGGLTPANRAGNVSSLNLRGLGDDKTLVLINGRRASGVVNLGTAGNAAQLPDTGQPDLNGIPLSAIERIEVLPTSASGIYGASALGGVVNVILKKNYTGGETRLMYDNTFSADSPSRTVGMTYGTNFNAGKTQVMMTAQWSDAEPLLLQDRREIIDRGIATIQRNFPAFFVPNTFNPFRGSLPNIGSGFAPVLTLRDGTSLGNGFTYIPAGTSPATPSDVLAAQLLANAGRVNMDLPPTYQNPTGLYRDINAVPTITSFSASLRQDLLPGMELTLDWMHTKNDSVLLAPAVLTGFIVPASSPRNPFNHQVVLSIPDAAVNEYRAASYLDSLSIGLQAGLPYDWTAQTDYTWSRSKLLSSFIQGNDPALDADLASGAINPFVDTLAFPINLQKYYQPAALNLVSNMDDIAIRGSGPLMSLPSGRPHLTIGLEHRINSTPENYFEAKFPITAANNFVQIRYARRSVTNSIYAETLVPLVKPEKLPLVRALDLQVSGRAERFEVDAGTPTKLISSTGAISYGTPTRNGEPYFSRSSYVSSNGTMGLRYAPVSSVTLRASLATAFLPPSPAQLIKNPLPNPSLSGVIDRRNNNQSVQVQTIGGGNPDLKPQNSESWNAGIIWEPELNPFDGVRFNAEYYKVDQYDAMGTLSAQLIVDNEGLFADRVIRNASGAITMVDTSRLNLYKRSMSGWDLSVGLQWATPFGRFEFNAAESIILSMQTQYSLTLPPTDAVNFPSEGGAAKYKSNATLNWSRKNWLAAWSARYFGSYRQQASSGGPTSVQFYNGGIPTDSGGNIVRAQGSESIPSQIYHDLYVGYNFAAKGSSGSLTGRMLSGVKLQAGIRNVFDSVPPIDIAYDFFTSPYGDMRLRTYWISAIKAF